MQSLLEGVTVLDLGRMHAASYCGKLMLDAGAEVIHVEQPDGDPLRRVGPFAPEDREQAFGAAFAFLNAGKKAVTLDYRTPAGAEVLWRLVERADILVKNGRPGTLDRHGFTTEALLERNPRLVRVCITNYGLTGPDRDFPATELTLQAAAGLMDTNGEFEREPLRYPMNIAQHWAGANAAYSALVAYWGALISGQGQLVDVSVQESLAATWWMQYADYQYTGSLYPRGQGFLIEASDGQLMANWMTSVPWEEYALTFDAVELAVEEDLKPPKILGEPEKLNAVINRHTRKQPRRHWMERCIESQVPVGMLQTLDEVAADPQMEARRFYDRLETPWGAEVPFPAEYWLLDGKPREAVVTRRVHGLGEDNEAVFGGLLGYGAEELARFRAEEAI